MQLPDDRGLIRHFTITFAEFFFKPLQVDNRYFVLTLMFPDFDHSYYRAEETTQHRDTVLVAIAMVRFRLAEGAWPDTLDALVPEYLDRVPVDRCAGKPFCLRYDDGQPLLYSVGFDGDDDQGEDAWKVYQGSNVITDLIKQADLGKLESLDGDWSLWPVAKPEPLLWEPPDGSDSLLLEYLPPDQ